MDFFIIIPSFIATIMILTIISFGLTSEIDKKYLDEDEASDGHIKISNIRMYTMYILGAMTASMFYGNIMFNMDHVNRVLDFITVIPYVMIAIAMVAAIDIDLRRRILPNASVLIIIFSALILINIRLELAPFYLQELADICWSNVLPAAITYGLSFIPKINRGIGRGDLKGICALFLLLGWEIGSIALIIAMVSHIVFMLFIHQGKAPFAPFLMGAMALFCWVALPFA